MLPRATYPVEFSTGHLTIVAADKGSLLNCARSARTLI
jgi:hypothetical protein